MSTIATRCREQPFENPNSSTLKFYYIQDESKVNNFLIFMYFVNFFVVKKINNPNTSSHLSSLVGLSVPTSLRRNHMLSLMGSQFILSAKSMSDLFEVADRFDENIER